MDFSRFLDDIVPYAQNHTVIAILVALCLLFFVYRKPKLFFVLLLLGLFLAGLLYTISNLAGSGSEQKRKLLPKEETQSDNAP